VSRAWPLVRLEELATKVGSGATPKGGEAAYAGTGVPFIRSMNVVFFGFKREGLAYLDERQAAGLENVEVRSGDILLNITGASIGRVTIAPSDMDGARVNQHVCIIRPVDGPSMVAICEHSYRARQCRIQLGLRTMESHGKR
jgi:type I restriction enzyme S subunit